MDFFLLHLIYMFILYVCVRVRVCVSKYIKKKKSMLTEELRKRAGWIAMLF